METNVPRKLTVTARTLFSPPHKAQMVSEGESQGRHLDTGGGFTRKHDRRARTANSLALDRQRRLPKTLRDHVWSASALSALKKSLVANLSAKRQLSVAKLAAEKIFSLAKRDFLVANGRMAADFSSPVKSRWSEVPFFDIFCVSKVFFSKVITTAAWPKTSWNSLIRFHCLNSCFLLETGIAGHERLFLAKRHPKAEKKLRNRPFVDTADRHEKLYGRSRLYASAQGRHETGPECSFAFFEFLP